MKYLQINEKKARTLYQTASNEFKAALEDTFGKEFFSMSVTERVKTFEDALVETGRPKTPEFADVPEDMRDWFKSLYNGAVFTEALNEGWKPDYKDGNQQKWLPWFKVLASSGFGFGDTYYGYSAPVAGDAARLCLRDKNLAIHAGKNATEIYKGIILK